MKSIQSTLAVITLMLAIVISGCSSDQGADEKQDSGSSTEARGEHERDRGGDGEGEESGTEYARDASYDEVRNGARLILAYDSQSNSFQGTVENTTNEILERVRVEVHLSNGTELGPTVPGDLKPGEKKNVTLKATSESFDGWSAHPEVGNEEGHGEEGGEHGSRESSEEHGGRERRGEHE